MIPYNCPMCGKTPVFKDFSVLHRKTYGCPNGCLVVPNKFAEYQSVLVLPDHTTEEDAIKEWNIVIRHG